MDLVVPMDAQTRNLEILATHSLAQRGLARAPDALAFAHKGQLVKVTIEKSVYRGHFLAVHDGTRQPRQFRALAGGYDWNAIAACIREVAERRSEPRAPVPTPAQVKDQNRRLADELSTLTGAGPSSHLSIQPSSSAPGRVRVRLEEIDLDPASVIQLYTAVARALPQKPKGQR